MNTLKTVFSKIIEKTELASNKVELNTIDDLKKKAAALEKLTYDVAQKDDAAYMRAQRVIKAFAEVQKLKDNFTKEMFAKDKVFKDAIADCKGLVDDYENTHAMYLKVAPLYIEVKDDLDKIYNKSKELGIDTSAQTVPIAKIVMYAKETVTKDDPKFTKEVKTAVIDRFKNIEFKNDWISE